MDTKHYDLIVFGGGNAISTAIQCGAKGLQVALVEKGPLGGTCPHRGCIPSKLLIGYADAAENARDARKTYAASLAASLWPRMRTVCCNCSTRSGFFSTVIGPFERMRSSISLSG